MPTNPKMSSRNWTVAEVVEELRNWEDQFNSESETQWLMNKAADIILFYIDTIRYIEEERKAERAQKEKDERQDSEKMGQEEEKPGAMPELRELQDPS